ncbi:MAG: transcription termination factor Rho [Actinomycetota bacterium]
MAAPQLGRAQLEEKERDDLMQIASALGIKGVAKATRETLIGKILEETMAPEPKETQETKTAKASKPAESGASRPLGADGEPLSEWELELAEHEGTPVAPDARVRTERSGDRNDRGESRGDGRNDRGESRGDRNDRGDSRNDRNDRNDRPYRDRNNNDRNNNDRNFGDPRNRRRRGRRRGPGGFRDEGPQGDDRFELDQVESNEPISTEPVKVEGYLDLRDEGYGFLRLNGYLPTRNDPYVSVRFTRQFGLRKGDHLTGLSRPAGRNEKNPALLEVHTVNGGEPEKARNRKKFEDLTPLFPDEKLVLSSSTDPLNMTARIVDLISPIGKGQRGIIVSPPKAGKTTVMKTIATSIEKNHPEVKLIVLLLDERPEEVTDMQRTVKGEVIASTFDRPSEEHTTVAELAIEKAKRMVEAGDDVVIILDGITRLSRAYNLAAPATGKIMSGGIDAGALYPPKKFFGAARNIEEGGSLTILATALVETNSRMDEAIFEEFKGTGNMELRLDRKLAERRIYPAIDVDASSTRHEELLFDRKQLQMVWKLRRVLSGLAADGNAAPGLELLIDRLKSFKTNDEFLSEIAKQPTA